MKQKKCYKTAVFSENVKPLKVVKALDYLLKNSELCSHENIHIDDQWMHALSQTEHPSTQNLDMNLCDTQTIHQELMSDENNDTETDEEFAETDTNVVSAPSTETMLDDINNMSISFAPGEGKRPVFHDPLAEYLAFPTIYCGKTYPVKRDHPIQQRHIFKYELQSVDTKVASNIPNIIWKGKHKQIKQIKDKVSLAA